MCHLSRSLSYFKCRDENKKLRTHHGKLVVASPFRSTKTHQYRRLHLVTTMLLEYNDLTCVQLRAICKERGLKQSGVKKVVIDRLLGNDNNASAPSTSPQNNDDDIGIILGSPTKVVATTELQDFQDETHTCLLFEGRSKYLSPSGLHFIANHQYRSAEYTHLDNLLNPFWTYLTECLPLWLAPNMVTTLGGMHCGLAYVTLWYYCPDFDNTPPDWVVMLAGYCSFAYYTLDCMDGKQARRTGSSSPLGQLL